MHNPSVHITTHAIAKPPSRASLQSAPQLPYSKSKDTINEKMTKTSINQIIEKHINACIEEKHNIITAQIHKSHD